MTRGLGWLLALALLTGCQAVGPESGRDPASESQPSPVAEPTAVVPVEDDLDRLIEAMPTDDQLHGYKGSGRCPTEAAKCGRRARSATAFTYIAEATDPGVLLRVTIATFADETPPSVAVDTIIGRCPDGPFESEFQMPKGIGNGVLEPRKGELDGTDLTYGDFTGRSCNTVYTYTELPAYARKYFRKGPDGQHEEHQAVLANDFYAVGFQAPTADLLTAMVEEYFARVGLA